MSFSSKVLVTTLLLSFGVAFSAEPSYFNITTKSGFFNGSSDVYLTQDSVPCTDATWNMKIGTTTYRVSGYINSVSCVASKEATPENLYSLVKENWVDKSSSGNLSLGTDLDLGEISETPGKCTVNHKPLPTKEKSTFEGNSHRISNLCYVSSTMTEPVGFFSSAKGGNVQNVSVDGVRIIVSGGSNDGADYYPVGALAGTLDTLTFSNIKLSNISIEAPFAGAAVGLVNNSTLTKVTAITNISVSNSQPITTGRAGSSFVDIASPYSVFLGGIAGVAIRSNGMSDMTLNDDKVNATIQDKATGHYSALGGAVGLVFSSQDFYRKVVASGSISGGSSMGGLFGYVSLRFVNNSSVISDTNVIKLDSSSFNGDISNASSPDFIAVGGLVGRDSLLAFSKLEIVSSSANITHTDEMMLPGDYVYFAGGILGYGSNCISSDRENDFILIEKTRSEGTLELNASAKAVDGLRVKAFMGGMVGAGCIAMEPRGFKDDTSSVVITSRIRTVGDSVTVGGMIGTMNVSGEKGVTISNLEYTGKIVVEDSLNNVYAGGIVGQFRESYGGKSINFQDVYVNANENVIEYKALAPSKTSDLKVKGLWIGGICAYCKETSLINKGGVYGGILVDGGENYVGDSLFVGGIMGRFDNLSNTLTIQNTYSIGDILVDANATMKKVGYLLGFGIAKQYSFRSNYHYGKNETVDAFGFISKTDTHGTGVTSWEDDADMTYNIRNGSVETYTDKAQRNGLELGEVMMTRQFAGVLNDALVGTAEDPNVWCFEAGSNGNLPFVTAKNADPVTNDPSYMVYFFDEDRTTLIGKFNVAEGAASARPEDPVHEGKTFLGWDKDSLLDNIISELNVYAQFKVDSFKVEFCTEEKCPFFGYYEEGKMVPYGATVDAPEQDDFAAILKKDGYNLVGWSDSSFAKGVKGDVQIFPEYEKGLFAVVYVNETGASDSVKNFLFEEKIENLGTAEMTPTEFLTFEFVKWTLMDGSDIPETMPSKDLAIIPVFNAKLREYEVHFLDGDGFLMSVAYAAYGDSIPFPEYESTDNRLFVGWSDSTIVTGPKTVKAILVAYVPPVDTSATDSSATDTSVVEHPSNPDDTTMVSSSSSSADSFGQESSSSEEFFAKPELASVETETSGNALRLNFVTKNVNPSRKTFAHVVISGEKGYLVKDSLMVENGEYTWEKYPLPVGEMTLELVVSNKNGFDSFKTDLKVASSIDIKPWSWRMVSLSKVNQDKVDWKSDASFYWWDEKNPIGDYWQYRTFDGGDVDPVRGYWFGSLEGSSLVLESDNSVPAAEIKWELDSFFSGWNMVANPYGWFVNLDTAAAAKEGIYFWRWDEESSQAVPADVVGPYESVWAQTEKNVVWKISAAPSFVKREEKPATAAEKIASLRKNVARKASASSWSLVASLKGENGKEDSWNVLGAGSHSETMGKAPAGMGKYVRLAIMDGKTKLAKSVKAFASEYEWTLKLTASENSDGELSFAGVDVLNKQGLALYVTVDGNTQEVNNSSSVKLALSKNSKEATVRVAPATVKTEIAQMSSFKVTPSANGLQIGFNAPENLAGATVSYALADVKGKLVAFGNFKAQMGSNRVSISTPKSGVYFVQMKLGSQNASAKVLVK